MVYVTHDQVEAMTMADKIVVLRKGYIEQVGSPLDLYRAPANLFVAGFIGSPAMNLVTGDSPPRRARPRSASAPSTCSCRSTAVSGAAGVGVSEHLGSDTFLRVDVDGVGTLTARADGEFPARHGDVIGLTPDPARLHRFDAAGLRIADTSRSAA